MEIANAANTVRQRLRGFTNQRQSLYALQDEVEDFRRNRAPQELQKTQRRHSNSGISDNHWGAFLLKHAGDVDEVLAGTSSGRTPRSRG